MAAPILAKIIAAKAPDLNIGEYVIFRNIRTGGKHTNRVVGSDRSIIFNPAPSLQWQEGDVIQAEIRGRTQGFQRKTIQKGGVNFTLTTTADTTTPGISL